MDMPRIPVTESKNQVDAVCDFCKSWRGPVAVSHDGHDLVLLDYEYYLAHFCTQEEQTQLNQKIAACAAENDAE